MESTTGSIVVGAVSTVDAALIVTAVNAHEAMRDELFSIRKWLHDSQGRTAWPERVASIDAALALANAA